MTQLAIPVDVSAREISREKSLGDAISLCMKAGGVEPKDLLLTLKWDKGQLSRWESGDEGIKWPKLQSLMDHCGNDAPLLWMAHDRGYDIATMRRVETEYQRENRMLREENARLRAERDVELRLIRDLRVAA